VFTDTLVLFGEVEGNQYADSIKFDPQLICDGGGFARLVKDVGIAIGMASPADLRQLRVLLANLLVVGRKGSGKWLAISKNRNSYGRKSLPVRYNRTRITFRVVKLLDGLRDKGLVEMKCGFNDRRTGRGFVTRVRPTGTLVKSLEDLPTDEAPAKDPRAEGIVMRDGKKALIDYVETAETRRKRSQLDRINHGIAKARIELPDGTVLRGPLCRIFNNGCWTHGGRFYGGEWESLPKGVRKQIQIDGKPTIERDFSALHIRMLYRREAGIDFRGDPYLIPGYESEDARDAFKKILLRCLNADSRTAAVRATLRDRQENPEDYPADLNVKAAVDAFLSAHAPIRHCFFKPALGVRLQNEDSEIANRVLLDLERQGIVALPIHDSFVVAEQHDETLRGAMERAYRDLIGGEPSIKYLLGLLGHGFEKVPRNLWSLSSRLLME